MNGVRLRIGSRHCGRCSFFSLAPLENIGIIILDEEHEATYKQDESPRYHARDVAIWRGEYHHCPVVLGKCDSKS